MIFAAAALVVLFLVARLVASLQLVHHSQERPPEEVVVLHLTARQPLKGDLVHGDALMSLSLRTCAAAAPTTL